MPEGVIYKNNFDEKGVFYEQTLQNITIPHFMHLPDCMHNSGICIRCFVTYGD